LIQSFPKGFLWSASTSAYQFEGAYLEDGKALSIVDVNINSKFADTSITSDHYHRLEEDVSLMKELGLKAYRFSISWPRVLPKGRGPINEKGFAFYDRLIALLKQHDIEPIVTLYHFDLPLALQEEYGGWGNRQIVEDFEYYVRTVMRRYANDIKYWLTINEQSNMFLLPYLLEFDPKIDKQKQKYQMNHYMTLAHAKAVMACRELCPKAKIGPALGVSPNYPLTSNPKDILASRYADDFRTYFFLDLYVKGVYRDSVLNYLKEHDIEPDIHEQDMLLIKEAKSDFIALNYYQSSTVKYTQAQESKEIVVNDEGKKGSTQSEVLAGYYEVVDNPHLEKNDWDWYIDPIGLRITLKDIHERYQLPLMITENGIGVIEELSGTLELNDDYRIDYYQSHLEQCLYAINEGVELIAYSPWSFMDLLSTTSGFRKRYGFVYVDRSDEDLRTLDRYKKKSFYWYQSVINQNRII